MFDFAVRCPPWSHCYCPDYKTSDSEEIQYLLIHFFFTVDEAVNHLFCLTVHRRHIEFKINFGRVGRARNVHDAIHADIIAREALPEIQVGQTDAVDQILGFQVQNGIIWIATKFDSSALVKLEILLDHILYRKFVDPMVYQIVAIEVEAAFIIVGGPHGATTIKSDVISCFLVHDKF